MLFEWDDAKAAANLTKHGVSFEQAITVFDDPLAITAEDLTAAYDEPRFITIGQSSIGLLILVVNVERKDRIRIVSARRATKREKATYEES
jgi:uncharacterized protein